MVSLNYHGITCHVVLDRSFNFPGCHPSYCPSPEHIGNIRFRNDIKNAQALWEQHKRSGDQKKELARKVVAAVKSRGGRFLKKLDEDFYNLNSDSQSESIGDRPGICPIGDLYVLVSDKVAIEKAKQCLRHHQRSMAPQLLKKNQRNRSSNNGLLHLHGAGLYPNLTNSNTTTIHRTEAPQDGYLSKLYPASKKNRLGVPCSLDPHSLDRSEMHNSKDSVASLEDSRSVQQEQTVSPPLLYRPRPEIGLKEQEIRAMVAVTTNVLHNDLMMEMRNMTGLRLLPPSALHNATASLQSVVPGETMRDHALSLMLSLPQLREVKTPYRSTLLPQHGAIAPITSRSGTTPSFGSVSPASTLVSLPRQAGIGWRNPCLFDHYGFLLQQKMAHRGSKSSFSFMADDPCCHPCSCCDCPAFCYRRAPTVFKNPEEGCFPPNLLLAARSKGRGNVRPFIL